ncbi:sulfotransferase family protein [Aliiglaciecola lipolytica]|uniref:TPR repeat-containing protein n=1 Tax=Aliiglaciecola lipolytica E3 TaxID=1127673 RepID=K6XNX9_9ALTE|nr:TPR repeat-containing protein [Aliiglaciecola lipolytica]GAC13366.1 TPR repeat-containing protein [Aliiglaciecola lipolytica E3]
MTFKLDKTKTSINQALKVIAEYEKVHGEIDISGNHQSNLNKLTSIQSDSQFNSRKCSMTKPTLRIIHHFACSGGTLISKCISALPNTFLLSETHPLSMNHISGKPKYLPSDVTTLARYAKVPDVEALAKHLFANNIKDTERFVREQGGLLVLREHSHIDFCVGTTINDSGVVFDCLKEIFDVKNLVTVRHPIDAYISLVSNDWVQFSPATFDEYCFRMLRFLDIYSYCTVLKYEDFVSDPDKHMRLICSELELTFDSSYRSTFSSSLVTGDSGRSGNVIEERERRPIEPDLAKEIKTSKNFKILVKRLKYSKDI